MNCPLCQSKVEVLFKEVKDHTVTKEVFEILNCETCDLAFTHPMPSMEEIGPYYKAESYISHTNTKKGLMNKLYHSIRSYMLFEKVKMITRFVDVKGTSTVDVGAGTGYFVNTIKKFGTNALGFEPDADARAMAQKEHGIELQEMEELFKLPANSISAITMWHVMEHVHEVDKYLAHYHEILKDNGVLVIAVPNYKSFDAAYYKENWAALDVPRHLWHFSPKSMTKWAEKHGFERVGLRQLVFDPAYIAMMSAGYKGRNKWLGLLRGMWYMLRASGDVNRASSPVYIFKKK